MNESITMRRDDFERAIAAEQTSETSSTLYLIVVSGGPTGLMIRLTRSGVRVGRALENTFVCADESISRHHAFLCPDDKGEVWMNDLGSTNGTFRNNERIPSETPVRLQNGDRIRFGVSTVVKFFKLSPIEEKFHLQLYERAIRDPLTGLMNRASFIEQLGLLAIRGSTQGLGISIFLMDVDHFKRVNDDHGHDVGDTVLRSVAETLQQSLRPSDLVGRYGGEEFIAAMAVQTNDQAAMAAERIRQNVADREILALGRVLKITLSIGVVFAPTKSSRSFDELIRTADDLLYQAKRAGRDRVAVEATEIVEPDQDQ